MYQPRMCRLIIIYIMCICCMCMTSLMGHFSPYPSHFPLHRQSSIGEQYPFKRFDATNPNEIRYSTMQHPYQNGAPLTYEQTFDPYRQLQLFQKWMYLISPDGAGGRIIQNVVSHILYLLQDPRFRRDTPEYNAFIKILSIFANYGNRHPSTRMLKPTHNNKPLLTEQYERPISYTLGPPAHLLEPKQYSNRDTQDDIIYEQKKETQSFRRMNYVPTNNDELTHQTIYQERQYPFHTSNKHAFSAKKESNDVTNYSNVMSSINERRALKKLISQTPPTYSYDNSKLYQQNSLHFPLNVEYNPSKNHLHTITSTTTPLTIISQFKNQDMTIFSDVEYDEAFHDLNENDDINLSQRSRKIQQRPYLSNITDNITGLYPNYGTLFNSTLKNTSSTTNSPFIIQTITQSNNAVKLHSMTDIPDSIVDLLTHTKPPVILNDPTTVPLIDTRHPFLLSSAEHTTLQNHPIVVTEPTGSQVTYTDLPDLNLLTDSRVKPLFITPVLNIPSEESPKRQTISDKERWHMLIDKNDSEQSTLLKGYHTTYNLDQSTLEHISQEPSYKQSHLLRSVWDQRHKRHEKRTLYSPYHFLPLQKNDVAMDYSDPVLESFKHVQNLVPNNGIPPIRTHYLKSLSSIKSLHPSGMKKLKDVPFFYE